MTETSIISLWVKPGPQTRVSLLAGRAGSWGLVARPRGRRAGVGPLVGGVSFVTVSFRAQGVSVLC